MRKLPRARRRVLGEYKSLDGSVRKLADLGWPNCECKPTRSKNLPMVNLQVVGNFKYREAGIRVVCRIIRSLDR